MANPLTSSDIIRQRMGFGVSELAPIEERQRVAAAGILPLTSGERRAFEQGRGISPLASQQTVEAVKMAEYMTGKRPTAPVSYGGIGDRPTGNSRRAIRMQAEWDRAMEAQANADKAARELAIREESLNLSRQAEQRLQTDQYLKLQEEKINQEREAAKQEQGMMLIDSIRGGRLPDGQSLRPIRPEDDDALERLDIAAKNNPYGLEHNSASKIFQTVYDDALKFRQQKLTDAQNLADAQNKWLVDQSQKAASLGVDASKYFKTEVDPETQQTQVVSVDQLGLAKAIGDAEKQALEQKGKALEQSDVAKDIKDQAKSIREDINKLDSEIRKSEFNAGRAKTTTERDTLMQNAEFLRSERERLVQNFNALAPQQPATTQSQAQPQLSQRNQEALDWANANPNDPRSQAIKAKLGVQ